VQEFKFTLTDAQTQKLAVLAEAHGRSPEDEAIELIRQQLFDNESTSERARRANEIAAMTPKDRVLSDSVVMLGEERRN
jgi:plasmid stability protein